MDSLTNYGTGWFEPFSHYRISFNTIFVADPFYTIALLISFIALLILKPASPSRKYFLTAGLAISTAYLLFTFINKISIDNIFKKTLAHENINYRSIMTTPAPLNNFLWYCMAETDSGFYSGFRSIFDKPEFMEVNFIPKNDHFLGDAKNDPHVQKLIRFSQNYYCITKNDSAGVDFHDIRFGQIGGWHRDTASFVFSYQITESRTGFVYINQGRFEAATGKELKLLIQRIKGLN
jgi:inner membrane protein